MRLAQPWACGEHLWPEIMPKISPAQEAEKKSLQEPELKLSKEILLL